MTEILPELVLLACVAAATLAHVFAWQTLVAADRLPLMVYSGSYLITSVIGATIIGLWGVEHLESLRGGLSTTHIRHVGDSKYWLLVYLPLIIPPLIVALLAKRPCDAPSRPFLSSDYCFPSAFLVVLAAATLFCTYCMSSNGFEISLGSWSRLSGEFNELMVLRQDIRNSVGSLFFRVLYGGLPALSFAALYQLYRHRTLFWTVLFAASFIVTSWFSLAIILKGICLVFVAAIGMGLIELKIARIRVIATMGIVCCLAYTLMQQLMVGEWGVWQSVEHVTHRMAVSFPYYMNVYPEMIPHTGLDLGLGAIGMAAQPTDNIDVFKFMYPNVTHVTGNVAAPAHLGLYAQCGMVGAIGAMFVIGVGIAMIVKFRQRINGPLSFAIYVQALVTIYYATQVSIVDLILSSFGFPWCLLTLIPLWAAAQLRSAQNQQSGRFGAVPAS